MAKMIDVTLVGGIVGQPTSDTVIGINKDEIVEISINPTGNSGAIVKMKNKKAYYIKETKQELTDKIDI